MCLMMKVMAIRSDQQIPNGWPKNSWKDINKIQKLYNNQQLPKGWRKSWLSLSESLRGELLLQVLEDKPLYSKVYSPFIQKYILTFYSDSFSTQRWGWYFQATNTSQILSTEFT